jgi:hypothetical protein
MNAKVGVARVSAAMERVGWQGESGRWIRRGRTIVVLEDGGPRGPARSTEAEASLAFPPTLPRFFQIVVGGKFLDPPVGVAVRNHFATSVHHFNPGRALRTGTVDELVIHETQTSSVSRTVSTLKSKGASVHFIVGPDGRVTQHGDLMVRMGHAEPHNPRSVGIEVVNPYVASRLQTPWTETIPARWSTKGYVLPTPEQAEVVTALIDWLTRTRSGGLSIPRRWVGELDGHLVMSKLPGAGTPAPGIYAHTYFCPTKCGCESCREDPRKNPCKCKHADGAWLVLYAWLRLEARLPAEEAYRRARELGRGRLISRVGRVSGRWVKPPDRPSPSSPADRDCVRPRVLDRELQREGGTGCAILPIAPSPTPDRFYTIKRGVDAKGLLDVAGRAYGVPAGPNRLALAQRINDHPYNRRFLAIRLASASFPKGRISFSPAFTASIAAQAAAQGAAPGGNAFATIYIPAR